MSNPIYHLAEFFPGMGTLAAPFCEGLSLNGDVVFGGAAELDGRYLELFSHQHPGASTYLGSVSHYAPEELLTASPTGAIRILVGGIPCTGSSAAGKSKRHLTAAEMHPDVGALFIPFLHQVTLSLPDLVVCENVPPYATSFSAQMIRNHLERLGYLITEKVVNPYTDFETATERKRWIMVASRMGCFHWNYTPRAFTGTIEHLLDPVSDADAADEFTAEQVAAHTKYLARKAAEGCGFARRILERTSIKVPTICKTYGKIQPSSSFLSSGETYRMLRPREIARIHGFGPKFIEVIDQLPKTTAYEVLGQGVVAAPFRSLGSAIGEWVASINLKSAA
ncbi:MAG: DNA cytosine methyltransferase [Opitutus sp.]|nr:DNA cytosine methyltransferase [Opitutus sp.]